MTAASGLMDDMELLESDQLDDLLRDLEKQAAADPTDLRSLLMLGNGYYLRGRIDAAAATFKKAVAVNPRLPYAYYYLGICHYRAMRLEEAIEALEQSLASSPTMIMADYWLGMAYYHRGHYYKARLAFEKLLENNQESVIAHYHAALACMADQAYDCALHHLEQLQKQGHADPHVMLYLGNVYFRLNRTREAIAAYKAGLEKHPGNRLLRDALEHLTEVQEP
ncbi:MAG TPA: tetratricopeptide repeat protein [bacterium]|nr:tetratricopeptide repeat protein [bacterium]HPR88481.1 tetratricopeptide repeat protein [bacterium]